MITLHRFIRPLPLCGTLMIGLTFAGSCVRAQSYNGYDTPPSSASYEGQSAGASVAVTALEEEVRRLTGRLETLEYEMKRLREQQAKLAQAPAPQVIVPAAGAVTALSSGSTAAPASSFPTPEQAAAAAAAAGALSVQGVPDDAASEGGAATAGTEAAPFGAPDKALGEGLKPSEMYDQALNAIKRSDYASAQTLLDKFIAANPKSPLIGNAYYWLGECYYAKKDYSGSAVQFLNGYQADVKGNKAPDNLLKLGMSLAGMGKKEEACTTYAKLDAEFSARKENASAQKVKAKIAESQCAK